jgi:hypothetical protein
MERFWKKLIDRMTTNCIKIPYHFAFNGVMTGLFAAMFFSWHNADRVDKLLGYFMLFMWAVYSYFLARAVDRLRDADPVSQPDQLVGLHLDQKRESRT